MSPTEIQQIVDLIAQRIGASSAQVKKDYFFDPFTYSINFLASTTPASNLPASGTISRNYIVQNDSAFVLCKTTYVATDTNNAAIANVQPFGSGGTTAFSPITVSLVDSGSGRSFMDAPLPIDSVYGTGQLPFVWPMPRIIVPSSVVTATLINLSATAMNVRLSHHGYKVFGEVQKWVKANVG